MDYIQNIFGGIRKGFTGYYNNISGIRVPQWIEVAIKFSIKHYAFIVAIIQFFRDNPALGTAIIVGGILMLTIFLATGFGPGGVTFGSLVAAWQPFTGNVAARSLSAILQSVITKGIFTTVEEKMVVAGMVVKLLNMKKWDCVLRGEPMGFVIKLD